MQIRFLCTVQLSIAKKFPDFCMFRDHDNPNIKLEYFYSSEFLDEFTNCDLSFMNYIQNKKVTKNDPRTIMNCVNGLLRYFSNCEIFVLNLLGDEYSLVHSKGHDNYVFLNNMKHDQVTRMQSQIKLTCKKRSFQDFFDRVSSRTKFDIWIQKSGKIFEVPLNKLSEADQDFVTANSSLAGQVSAKTSVEENNETTDNKNQSEDTDNNIDENILTSFP